MNVKERAVEHLLKPPAIEYVRSLKDLLQKDSDYINTNRVDIGNIIHGFLAGAGFLWDGEIFEKEWPGILWEALARLESKKP
jgi:hypothetical protein